MAGPSNLMAQAMVNHLMRGSAGAYTLTGPWKVKLWTTSPNYDAGTGGAQLTGTGYTAGGQAITMAAASWNAAGSQGSGRRVSNIAVPTWTATAADWSAPIAGASLVDASGYLMWGKALDTVVTIGSGSTFRFSAAALKLDLDTTAMAGISDFWKGEILDHFCCTDRTYTAPATAYLALFTTAPNHLTGAGGTECAAGDYARKAITMNAEWGPADASGTVNNAAEIAFSAASSNWGTIVAAGLVSTSSGAFDYFAGNSHAGVAIGSGDTYKIVAGDFNVSMA